METSESAQASSSAVSRPHLFSHVVIKIDGVMLIDCVEIVLIEIKWVALNGWVNPQLRGRWAGNRSHYQALLVTAQPQ